MFSLRPPAPRYQSVWNVGMVIEYTRVQPPLKDSPLKEISKRLVVPLAFSNASRSSDLHTLDIRFQQSTTEEVRFLIPGLMKTRCSEPPREAFYAGRQISVSSRRIENLWRENGKHSNLHSTQKVKVKVHVILTNPIDQVNIWNNLHALVPYQAKSKKNILYLFSNGLVEVTCSLCKRFCMKFGEYVQV